MHRFPRLPQEQFARWLQAADLCVRVTREESFGIVVAEAMACGTPVVSSAVGGIPEIVQHGRYGLLAPPQDAAALAESVIQLLTHTNTRLEFGLAGAEHSRVHFDQRRITRVYLDWFQEVFQ